jgi:hypothetical protein
LYFDNIAVILALKPRGGFRMKYFGEKSFSSVMSVILRVSWFVVLVLSIITAVMGVGIIVFSSLDSSTTAEIVKGACADSKDLKDWEGFQNLPLIVKLFMLPYFGALAVLLLKIIKEARRLFVNFKNNVLFNESNALIISNIAKLNIWFAILTFNFSALLASLFLLMLCEIIKNGTMLQEEHDLTV